MIWKIFYMMIGVERLNIVRYGCVCFVLLVGYGKVLNV